ncbi:hypothetical protein ACHAQA_003258 [Verticillium albo-atrum]
MSSKAKQSRSTPKEGPLRFPAIARAPLSLSVARDFLAHANETATSDASVVLVARRDLSVLLTPDATDGDLDDIQTFIEKEQHEVKIIKKFMKDISGRSDLGGNGFVELDEFAASDEVCLISTDATKDDFAEDATVSFRSNFKSTFAALSALQSGSKKPRQHRNDAARCGGIWKADILASIESHRSGIEIASLPTAPKEDPEREGEFQNYPVFRTADISLETLNLFIKDVFDYEHDEDANPCIAFVTRLDTKPFTQAGPSKVGDVLDEVPLLDEVLKYATPEECGELLKRRFHRQKDLDLNFFIIMDHLTETNHTVIVACQYEMENDGELILMRCAFNHVMVILVAVASTSLSFENSADTAAREKDGIARTELDDDEEWDDSNDEASSDEED